MSILITDVRYSTPFRTGLTLNYLQAVIDEPITVEIDFNYQEIQFSREFNRIILKPDKSTIDLHDNEGIIYSENKNAFVDTYVGDVIGINRDVTSDIIVNVIEKIDDQTIRTDGTFNKEILSIKVEYIFNATPFAGLRFLYNLIDGGGGFNSLIDAEQQRVQIGTLDTDNTTPQAMVFTGAKSWHIGDFTVVGRGGDGVSAPDYERQKFTITQNTVVTPTFLASQYEAFVNGESPEYFSAEKCLNYIAEISLGRSLNNPNGLQTVTLDTNKSTTGFYGENFNGGNSNYSVTDVVLTDVAEGVTLDQLEYSKEITVDITISNTVDSPFSNNNTKYMAVFRYLPESEDLYQKNGFDQVRNFAMDSKLNTLGDGPEDGDNFGTSLQIIKTVDSTFISATEMKVTILIETGSAANEILQQGDFARYKISVITENHALDNDKSDRVNLLADFTNEFHVQLTTTDLIKSDDINFIQHPYTEKANATAGTALKTFPVDDLVANMDFHIDFTDHPADELIKIVSVRSELIITDGTTDISLEDSGAFVTVAAPIVGGQAQNIDFAQDRVFKIPEGIRKTITITRNTALDSGNELHYNFQYPFMLRWEYWEKLALETIPADLFDNTLPNDGINHFWQRLAATGSWELNYRTTFIIEQNGLQFEQVFTTPMAAPNDYNSNPKWGDGGIKTFASGTTDELVNTLGTKFVTGFESAILEAKFEKITGSVPALTSVGMQFWIEEFEVGGQDDARRISSFYEIGAQSWFASVDASNKIKITKDGGVFTGQVLVDHTKIPPNKKFTVYARLFEFTSSTPKQFEDGDFFFFEDNVNESYDFEANVTLAGLTLDLGTLIREDFSSITDSILRSAPVPVIPEQPATDRGECCFVMPVFAETVKTSDLKNDKSNYEFFWNNGFNSATMTLQVLENGVFVDKVELDSFLYGTFKSFGSFVTKFDENFIGILLDWRTVFMDFGAGTYRVISTGDAIIGDPVVQEGFAYCLKEYSDGEAHRTLRLNWNISGTVGNVESDERKTDFGTLNWEGMLRLPETIVWGDNSERNTTDVKYQTGEVKWLSDSQIEKYIMEIGPLPSNLHRYIKILVLQADIIRVTTYDELNPNSKTEHAMIWDDGYEPDWNYGVFNTTVEIGFKQHFQNFDHKRG